MRRSSAEIRHMFLDFFHNKQHTLVASSSLVPNNDPSLLFTNAGMNQFKNIFLGLETPNYLRAASAQRCLRAGGKHNDLENVGYTARHHTFFEMLGNFSFGDYGKSQAIHFAWELLTSTEWFAIPEERLWITLYESDDDTYAIWTTEIGVPAQRIIRIGDNKGAPYASDNFWQMGETGPCGPCTEIFYDHGDTIPGALPGDLTSEEGDRYTEIWNIVFIQFNRQPNGTLLPLPKLSVDTGMGLERITAVLQEVHSNYETDLFRTLIDKAAQITQSTDRAHPSLQVIADHIRAAAFLIADGIMPSNDGRGYVLRRIIRRAVRHGRLLGLKVPFFYQLTGTLIDVMGPAAAPLKQQQALIEKLLISEEQHFIRNLAQSLNLLDNALAQLKGNILSGETAFKLHDTYGLPLDLTIEICREHNINVDEVAFEREMTAQRQRAQRSSPLTRAHNTPIQVDSCTTFCGYEKAQETAQVIELWSHGKAVTTLTAGDQAIVILNQTPFYGTSGGQVGDSGWLNGTGMLFTVYDTQHYNRAIGHSGTLMQGTLAIGDCVEAKIDESKRMKIRCNHSATHLLHAALRQVLGIHVVQKGSLVSADCLRFDFSQDRPLTIGQRWQVEALVNAQIRYNLPIETTLLDLESAQAQGAIALFGEKYDSQVRMLSIGDFSIELCGGTHALQTGDLGLFRIVSESSVAAGVRRIEAFTGEQAIQQMQAEQSQLLQTAALVKGNSKQIVPKIENLLVQQQQLEKKIQQLNQALASRESLMLINNVVIVKNANLIIKQLQAIEANILPLIVDDLKNQLKSAIILLATVNNQCVHVIAAVTADLLSHITAHELINRIKLQIDGKGGGHSEMAQATGNKISAVPEALTAMTDWIIARL